jgi:hypothetical protein
MGRTSFAADGLQREERRMYLNRRPNQSSARATAALALTLLWGAVANPLWVQAQVPPFPTPLPGCYTTDSPDNDVWPRAVTDSLGSTDGATVTFSAASLLANDIGSGLAILSVGPSSNGGGTITGTDPYAYTPNTAFGADAFPYEIIQMVGTEARTSMGIVKISVAADTAPPTVRITSPLAEQVSGNVVVKASASDNVGVTSVTFFDSATQIGVDDTSSPFEQTWATATVTNGSHTLTVIARDAAGHATTSGAVVVNVNNVVSVVVPGVLGLSEVLAVQAISNVGLIADLSSANSPSAPIGSVLSQAPAGGTAVAQGSHVAVITSLGALVPNVVGSTETAATTSITGAGLTLGVVTTASSTTVASGSVISQNPAGNTNAAPGSGVAIVVSTGAPVVTPPPAGGLVLALGFEEATGGAVTDSSALPMNGTFGSGATAPTRVAAGKIGRALSFDGGDVVGIADVSGSKLDLTNGMTLEAWVNPTSMNGWESVIYKERGGVGTGLLSYALYAHDGGTNTPPAGYVRTSAGGPDRGIQGPPRLPLNTWSHIAVSYTSAVGGSTLRFYVNGALVTTVSGPNQNILAGNQPLRIGSSNAQISEGFNGRIDEVRVYSRALSASEITADMTTPIVQ